MIVPAGMGAVLLRTCSSRRARPCACPIALSFHNAWQKPFSSVKWVQPSPQLGVFRPPGGVRIAHIARIVRYEVSG